MTTYLSTLVRRSLRLFLTLAKIMLPVLVAVRIGESLGLVDAVGRLIAPAMDLIGLPPEAGIIWVTGVFTGVYGAVAALIGFAATLQLTSAQLSALCAMIVFAHALPVEQSIVRRAGASFWITSGLRVGAAVCYGGAVVWFCGLAGVLDQPVSLAWLQGSRLAADSAGHGLLAWIFSTAFSLGLTFVIILALLLLLDVLDRTGATRRFTALMTPVLRLSGLDPRAAPVTTVGVMLGLTYGGALIIEEAEKQRFVARTRFLALAWLSLSHGLIEDTALMLALGANAWVVLAGRVLLTLVVVGVLARLWPDRPDGVGLQAGRA